MERSVWRVGLGVGGRTMGSVKSLCFSLDGTAVAVCGTSRCVALVDAYSGERLWETERGNKIRALSFAPLGETLAVGDDDGRIALLDALLVFATSRGPRFARHLAGGESHMCDQSCKSNKKRKMRKMDPGGKVKR